MLPPKILEILSHNKLFENVKPDDLAWLTMDMVEERSYLRGAYILREDDPKIDSIYLITAGVVQITKKLATGDDHAIKELRAGDFIGEMSLLEGEKRSASARCLIPVTAMLIHHKAFNQLLVQVPHVQSNLIREMAAKLRESDVHMISEISRAVTIMRLNQVIADQKAELENQKMQLQELNAAKDKFFSIIAHDIKNPLASLMGFSELMHQSFGQLELHQIRSIAESIYDSSHHLYNLIENLLQWARSQTGSLVCEQAWIALAPVVNETVLLLTPSALSKQIQLIHQIAEDHSVYVDRNMFSTVIRNLISNAIKFSHPGGQINIRSIAHDRFIEVAIKDSGVGIPADMLSALFRIDVQQSTHGTANESGTGLGLILCKEFVEKNGGTIRVESEVGIGSTFFISLRQATDNIS